MSTQNLLIPEENISSQRERMAVTAQIINMEKQGDIALQIAAGFLLTKNKLKQ